MDRLPIKCYVELIKLDADCVAISDLTIACIITTGCFLGALVTTAFIIASVQFLL